MLRVLRSAFVMASIAAAATAAAAGEQLGGEQLVFGRPGESVDIKTFDKPALSDLLTIDPSISMFYDYVRQSETLVSTIAPLRLAYIPTRGANHTYFCELAGQATDSKHPHNYLRTSRRSDTLLEPQTARRPYRKLRRYRHVD